MERLPGHRYEAGEGEEGGNLALLNRGRRNWPRCSGGSNADSRAMMDRLVCQQD